MIPEEDLHDGFEPQSGNWIGLLLELQAYEGLIENIGAWGRKYRRIVILDG